MKDRLPGEPMELPPRRLTDLDVDEFLKRPGRKQAFVTPMFDRIAPRYDRFTRWFSFGMDARWKRAVVECVSGFGQVQDVLDVACGTGDLAIAVANKYPGASVVAVDASPAMVRLAQTRIASTGVAVAAHEGDMMGLPVEENAVDVITAGYAVRNAPDARVAVREMARVARPGAMLVTLDFYLPENQIWRSLFLWYLWVAGNVVGWWWHRDPVVYGYIAHSIRHFMTARDFAALLADEGFDVVRELSYLGGGVVVHCSRKATR